MIIVEGPDNSGKSTLVEQLRKDLSLEKLSSKHPGPKKSFKDLEVETHYFLTTAIHYKKNNIIMDRCPLISEEIYGPLLRGKNLWYEDYYTKVKFTLSLQCMDPFIIYCRPPSEVVLDFENHQVKEYDSPEHLASLSSQKGKVLKAYDAYFGFYGRPNFFRYDYTNPNHYPILLSKLKEFIKW